eukprot:10285171-Ditylum_brightwellii.AAC.2
MEHEQIRKLMLDVTSKTYHSSSLDLSDDLLTQINEHHQTVADHNEFAKYSSKVQKLLNLLNKHANNASKLNKNLDTGQAEKEGIAKQVVMSDENKKNKADQ